MRIISGKFRNIKLETPSNHLTRPMSARVKEDLFNVLNNYFDYTDKVGLDIFAGTGQLGLEFISRGGQQCYLNDYSDIVNKMLIRNTNKCKAENQITILKRDYMGVLAFLKGSGTKIDILFLDPPFKEIEYYFTILDFIFLNKILNNFGIIACESENKMNFDKYNLDLLKMKKYASKYLYVLRMEQK